MIKGMLHVNGRVRCLISPSRRYVYQSMSCFLPMCINYMLCNTQIHRTSGLWYSAEYSTFSISDEVSQYRLTVAEYSDPTSDTKMSYY